MPGKMARRNIYGPGAGLRRRVNGESEGKPGRSEIKSGK
jgi:hypothetical protein